MHPFIEPRYMYVIGWVMFLVVACLHGMRFWINRHRLRTSSLLAMDVLSVMAMLAWLALLSTVTYYIKLDIDRDESAGITQLHPFFANVTVQKMFFWTPILYVLCLWLIKGAFLAMYYDVLPWNSIDNKKLKTAMYGATAYCILTFIAEELSHLLKCRPISEGWAVASKICTKPYLSRDLIIATYISNVTTDLFILLIPLMIIRTLNLRRAHWTAVSFLLMIASMSIAAASLRFIFLLLVSKNFENRAQDMQSRLRATYDYTLAVITWTSVELWATCIAFGLPPLRVYLRPLTRPLLARDQYGVTDGQLSSAYYAKATGGTLKMQDRNAMLNSETELRTILVEQSLEQTVEHVDGVSSSRRSQGMKEIEQGV